MATLRRGLVDTVKKAAAKAGTRGARALVETTAAAVKTVDKLQAKLGRGPLKPSAAPRSEPMTAKPMVSKGTGIRAPKTSAKSTGTTGTATKSRRIATASTPEAKPVELRESGRKTMPATAPKRSKQARTAGKQFKVKRGQKHLHSGR